MDLNVFRKNLKTLQGTQDDIPKLSRSVAAYPTSAESVFNIMVEEAIATASRRLLIFYLFNDIVQYAARKRLTEFLEKGSGVFLHGFGPLIDRLPIAERSTYLRTIDIWRDRAVYSASFCSRLRNEWETYPTIHQPSSPRRSIIDHSEIVRKIQSARGASIAAKEKYNELFAKCCAGQQLPASISDAAALLSALKTVEAKLVSELQIVGVARLRFSDNP